MTDQKMREALDAILAWDWQSLRRTPESPDWADALQAIDDAAEALAAPAQPVAVPDGMVLVPVEPTEEMHRAGLNACDDTWISDTRQVNARVYRAMLAAAPASHEPTT